MAVNISGKQFSGPELEAAVQEVLEETTLDPRWLELEITEGTAMENEGEAMERMHRLAELGVGITIDDFGTGYSSLSRLQQFPIQRLKIDRTFVTNLLSETCDSAIVESIIGLGRSLELKVLAEGVEQQDQANYLKSKGCDKFQGFLFGRPQAADSFFEMAQQAGIRAAGDTAE